MTTTISSHIIIQGAKENNLKDISLSIPKNQLVVITGVSGSGKSSIAFDTLFQEGQRRYIESFGSYAHQFIGQIERPKVEKIDGLSPVISIEQKTTNYNPRSTVGTVTEIFDFLRLLYARTADAFSLHTGKKMIKFSEEALLQTVMKNFSKQQVMILSPLVRGRKGHYKELFSDQLKKGYTKIRIDNEITDLVKDMQVDRYKIHNIELIIDRITIDPIHVDRISASIKKALTIGEQLLFILPVANKKQEMIPFSTSLMCSDTGLSYEEPSPNTFSFNSPFGACPHCKGIGEQYTLNIKKIIPNPQLSVHGGGIIPIGEKKNSIQYNKLECYALKHHIPLHWPINLLSQEQLHLLLYANEEEYDPEIKTYQGIASYILHIYQHPNTSNDRMKQWAEQFIELSPCETCKGIRLKKESLCFKIDNKDIGDICMMTLSNLLIWVQSLNTILTHKQKVIAKDLLKELEERLHFLVEVGLGYLHLHRSTKTLSGGETQRTRLATQIGSHLQGILYILDEPSIGLHQRDNNRLIRSLKTLRDRGNSILVVEHDRDMMLQSDYLIDIGPRAGKYGGEVIAATTPKKFITLKTTTAGYLNQSITPSSSYHRKGNGNYIKLYGARGNNLKNIDVSLPLGTLIIVTGVSGSGKSTLVNDTLYPILHNHIYGFSINPLPYEKIEGLEYIDRMIAVDQSPIGRTPRSNPATYCGFFTDIRQLYASLPESKVRGYQQGRFSFNVESGRCEHCEGGGLRTIKMEFLPDVFVTCEKCLGKRYNKETLDIHYKGKSISDILNMTVEEASIFFQPIPHLYRKIKVLDEVGLGYIQLGQSAVSFSGGEAQRIKLATELTKRDTGKSFYIFDEPTTGLHFQDIDMFMKIIHSLINKGNTVCIIEHNIDVIKQADYIIDIGPEAGIEGGEAVFQGPIADIKKVSKSITAKFL